MTIISALLIAVTTQAATPRTLSNKSPDDPTLWAVGVHVGGAALYADSAAWVVDSRSGRVVGSIEVRRQFAELPGAVSLTYSALETRGPISSAMPAFTMAYGLSADVPWVPNVQAFVAAGAGVGLPEAEIAGMRGDDVILLAVSQVGLRLDLNPRWYVSGQLRGVLAQDAQLRLSHADQDDEDMITQGRARVGSVNLSHSAVSLGIGLKF